MNDVSQVGHGWRAVARPHGDLLHGSAAWMGIIRWESWELGKFIGGHDQRIKWW